MAPQFPLAEPVHKTNSSAAKLRPYGFFEAGSQNERRLQVPSAERESWADDAWLFTETGLSFTLQVKGSNLFSMDASSMIDHDRR